MSTTKIDWEMRRHVVVGVVVVGQRQAQHHHRAIIVSGSTRVHYVDGKDAGRLLLYVRDSGRVSHGRTACSMAWVPDKGPLLLPKLGNNDTVSKSLLFLFVRC